MYKLISEEINGSMRRSIFITKADALKVQELSNSNVKNNVKILKKALKCKSKNELVEFFEDNILEYLVCQDWLYDYDVINNLSEDELRIGIASLEKSLNLEKIKLITLLNLDYKKENIASINELMRNINKYIYQINTIIDFAREKYNVDLLDNSSKTK